MLVHVVIMSLISLYMCYMCHWLDIICIPVLNRTCNYHNDDKFIYDISFSEISHLGTQYMDINSHQKYSRIETSKLFMHEDIN